MKLFFIFLVILLVIFIPIPIKFNIYYSGINYYIKLCNCQYIYIEICKLILTCDANHITVLTFERFYFQSHSVNYSRMRSCFEYQLYR